MRYDDDDDWLDDAYETYDTYGDDEYDDDDERDQYDDSSETIVCPACGADVYEDSPRCPTCGNYITPSTSPLSGRPQWYVLLALVGVAAAIVALTVSFCF